MHAATPLEVIQSIFELPLFIWLWQKGLILAAVLIAAWVTALRAHRRGVSPSMVANQLTLGLLIGIAIAYHLVFTSLQTSGQPAGGALAGHDRAVHATLISALLAALVLMRWKRLSLLAWLDICVPALLLGQAILRLSYAFGHEVAGALDGGPLAPLGLPAILYELLRDLTVLGSLLWAERRLQGRLRPGDTMLLYGLLYALGSMAAQLLRGGWGRLDMGLLLSLGIFALSAGVLAVRRLRPAYASRAPEGFRQSI
jgi:prolipoprotein diacylglyceryltransferase